MHGKHVSLGSPRELAYADFEIIVRRIANDVGFGSDASQFVGPGLEYSASRPYQPGDSLRSFNWRLTGRTGCPFVKQYEVMRRVPVYIVVDTSHSMVATSTPTAKLDLAIWSAAAIGLLCQRRMSPVALLSATTNQAPARPSLRQADLWMALDNLRAGQSSPNQGLGHVLTRIEATARSTSLVIVLSDWHDPSATPALLRAALGHDCIAIRLLDPAELGTLRAGFFAGHESETGRAFTGHNRTQWANNHASDDQLLAAGIDVLAVRTDENLSVRLRHFLESRGTFTRKSR